MSIPSNVCLECGGRKYIHVSDETRGRSGVYPCPECNGTGTEPTPDPLNPHPCADPVVRAILAMGEGER